ncbi:MAG: UvrD-helicase domain-containing protein [bacterium]
MDIQLDKSQQKAVTYDRGNLLVIAGPGAGKTRVIIGRMLHLIKNGVQPDRILAVTFTNKAADEINDRIAASFPDSGAVPSVSTFHSLALKIIREFHEVAGLKKFFTVIDDNAQDEILTGFLRQKNIKPSTTVLRRLRSHMDFEKANACFPLVHPNIKKELEDEIREVFKNYQKFLAENDAVDFNDLILLGMLIMQGDEVARQKFRNKYDHILLDEFQDINYSQYELTRLLIRDDAHVLAVADSNQMIYNWRGSDSRLMNCFLRDLKAERMELTTNYRSAEELILATRELISRNKPPGEKKVKIPDDIEPRIAVFEVGGEVNTSQAVVKIVKTNLARGYKPGDIGIIYRMHGFGDDVERELSSEDIPLMRVRPSDDFIREGIDQLMSYLKLSQNLFDWDVKSAWDFPRRVLNPLEGYRITEQAGKQGTSLFKLIGDPDIQISVSPLALNRLKRFSKLVEELTDLGTELSPSGYFRNLRKKLSAFLSPFSEPEESKLIEHLSWISSDKSGLIDRLLNEDNKPHVLILHPGGTMLQLASLMIAGTLRNNLKINAQIALSNKISDRTWQSLSKRVGGENSLVVIHIGSTEKTGGFLEEFWNRGFSFEMFEIKPPIAGEQFLISLACFRFLIDLLTRMPVATEERLVFYDLETTGIDTRRCEIIELSALSTSLYSSELEMYNSLVKPNSPPPPFIQELTGITPLMLEDALSPDRVINEFHGFSHGAVYVGHNIIGYDNEIMDRYYSKVLGHDFLVDSIDTVLWARELFPGKSNRLEALGERFGLETKGLHRAGEDVRLNRDVFYKLLEIDGIKRGLDFSPDAVIYMALMALERDEAEKGAGIQFLHGAIRLLADDDVNLKSVEKNIRQAFSEKAADELLGNLKLLKKEQHPPDPQRERWENLADYLGGLIMHYEEKGVQEGIGGFVNHYSLLREGDFLQEGDMVKMMSIHAAKGLEFPVVIIVGLEQGSIPHYLALDNLERVEEERRLLYVAITRAKEKAYLIYTPKRGGRYRPESMFIKEIPEKLFKRYRLS